MVFITPTFTNGASIMEAVAFGGRDATSGEKDWNSVQFGKEQQDNRNRVFLFK